MTDSKIDVIIPVYKALKTLPRALASVLEQTIVDQVRVFLVIDGEFTVEYDRMIKAFNELSPEFLIRKYCSTKNMGPGVCRQIGIDNTDSEYIVFLDADDTFAGSYSLELLYKHAQAHPEAACIVGNFAEEQPGLKFFTHPNDSVWIFGKLYRRSFIEKFGIRFNDTRANEDTGFNTKIKLCADKNNPILSIQDVVYYWHYKEDSITRKNNCEYSYGESFVGYVDNMIESIKFAKSKSPFNGYIDKFTIQTMVNLYIYWLQTAERDEKYSKQNFNCCVKYYKEIFSEIMDKLRKSDEGLEILKKEFAREYHSRANEMMDICPEVTFFGFLSRLEEEYKKEKKEVE